MFKRAYLSISLLVCLALILVLPPTSTLPVVSADSTVWIDNFWLDGNNNLQVHVRGNPDYYRLYVRRTGATFGDYPHYQYYQVYPFGDWSPKHLVNVVVNALPNTVYCAEITSNDGSLRHDIISYQTGSSGPPYYGSILGHYCTVDGNTPPNPPNLVSPANGSTTDDPTVTLCLQDTGDPDNYPWSYRDFHYRLEKTDGTWSQEHGWTTDTCWTVTVPSEGTYRWRAQSGDGDSGSAWTAWWTFGYNPPAPPPPPPPPPPPNELSVPYADQVYVQQTPECFPHGCYWNHCGPASVAMILSYYGKVGDVLYDRQPTLDLVPRVKPNGSGAASKGLMERTLQEEGLQIRSEWNPTFSSIKQNIENEHPILLSIAGRGHVLVATGFEDSDTVIVNDPYGGKEWWYDYTQKNCWDGGWVYNPAAPQLKGEGVRYHYGTEITGWYGIFVTGPAPSPLATQAVINTAQTGVLSSPEWLNQSTQIIFPGSESRGQFWGTVTTLTVTHTPQFTPTYQTEGLGADLASFHLSASDASGHSVQQFSRPFTLTVNLDPSIVDGLDIADGSTPAEETSSSSLTTTDSGSLFWSLSLTYWDEDLQQWTVIPTRVDEASHQVTAQSDRFTEYAVVVRYFHQVYLPLVLQ